MHHCCQFCGKHIYCFLGKWRSYCMIAKLDDKNIFTKSTRKLHPREKWIIKHITQAYIKHWCQRTIFLKFLLCTVFNCQEKYLPIALSSLQRGVLRITTIKEAFFQTRRRLYALSTQFCRIWMTDMRQVCSQVITSLCYLFLSSLKCWARGFRKSRCKQFVKEEW